MTKDVYWTGSNPKCDLGNGHKLNGVIYDARIPAYRQWGLVCETCAKANGIQLGLGKGQKYKLQADNRWLKVEG